jgi:hypothetical protein
MTQIDSTKAYYLGRNSIGDEGEVWYRMDECPEVNTNELRESFKRGVRHVRSEIRLDNDTEWDNETHQTLNYQSAGATRRR